MRTENAFCFALGGKVLAAQRLLHDLDLTKAPEGVSVLAVALFRLSRSLKAKVSHTVNTQPDPLGIVAWRILMGLSLVESATQRELVDFASSEQAQVSRVLKDLDKRGLIVSRPCPTDGRARVSSITDLGKACRAQHMSAMTSLAEKIDDVLSETERTQFLEMCARIEVASNEDTNLGKSSSFDQSELRTKSVHREVRT